MLLLDVDLTQGINGNTLGENIERFVSLLGNPEELIDTWKQQDGTEFYQYYSRGMSLKVVSESVQMIVYYYQKKQFKPFEGKVLQGIHRETSPTDVIKLFGEPEKTSSYLSSGRGEFPGVQETNLSYHDKYGLYFVFYNDKIADIRHSKKNDNTTAC